MSSTPNARPIGFRVTRPLIPRDIFALRAWLVRFRFYDLYTILRGAISATRISGTAGECCVDVELQVVVMVYVVEPGPPLPHAN